MSLWLMMSIDLRSIAILSICGIDYGCIVIGVNKSEAVNAL